MCSGDATIAIYNFADIVNHCWVGNTILRCVSAVDEVVVPDSRNNFGTGSTFGEGIALAALVEALLVLTTLPPPPRPIQFFKVHWPLRVCYLPTLLYQVHSPCCRSEAADLTVDKGFGSYYRFSLVAAQVCIRQYRDMGKRIPWAVLSVSYSIGPVLISSLIQYNKYK